MKRPATMLLLILTPTVTLAQSNWRPLETTEEARQRHNAERYQQHQSQGTPLGGYQDRLGDTAPRGTESPGYRSDTWRPTQSDDRRSNPYQYDRRRMGW